MRPLGLGLIALMGSALGIPLGSCGPDSSQAEAQALFTKMSDTLAAAPALHIESRSSIYDTSHEVTWLFIRSGNRVRIQGTPTGNLLHTLIISDGDRLLVSPYPNQYNQEIGDAPYTYGKDAVRWFTQIGSTTQLALRGNSGARGRTLVRGLKFGENDQGEGRATRELRYRIGWQGTDAEYEVRLWVDAKTLLPVKRVVRSLFKWAPVSDREGSIQGFDETYTRITLDGKIDPALFEIVE